MSEIKILKARLSNKHIQHHGLAAVLKSEQTLHNTRHILHGNWGHKRPKLHWKHTTSDTSSRQRNTTISCEGLRFSLSGKGPSLPGCWNGWSWWQKWTKTCGTWTDVRYWWPTQDLLREKESFGRAFFLLRMTSCSRRFRSLSSSSIFCLCSSMRRSSSTRRSCSSACEIQWMTLLLLLQCIGVALMQWTSQCADIATPQLTAHQPLPGNYLAVNLSRIYLSTFSQDLHEQPKLTSFFCCSSILRWFSCIMRSSSSRFFFSSSYKTKCSSQGGSWYTRKMYMGFTIDGATFLAPCELETFAQQTVAKYHSGNVILMYYVQVTFVGSKEKQVSGPILGMPSSPGEHLLVYRTKTKKKIWCALTTSD